MAANMIVDVLKQFQKDLGNISEKLSGLNNKVDQQQVTLDRLEQQLTKNNNLLFGNDETDTKIKELSLMLYKPKCNDNNTPAAVENEEGNQFQNKSKSNLINKNDDKVNEFIIEDPVQLKEKTSADETIGEISKEDNIQVSSISFSSENINRMDNKLEQIMSEIIEMKELIKEITATKGNPVDETTSAVCKEETVQITLNYLSRDQISKLNDELKQITEKYQSTNIFPVVELIPGPAEDHPVMEQLSKGFYYHPKSSNNNLPYYYIRLGLNGFKRSELQDLLTEYPNFSVHEVIQDVLRAKNDWEELKLNYQVCNLKPY